MRAHQQPTGVVRPVSSISICVCFLFCFISIYHLCVFKHVLKNIVLHIFLIINLVLISLVCLCLSFLYKKKALGISGYCCPTKFWNKTKATQSQFQLHKVFVTNFVIENARVTSAQRRKNGAKMARKCDLNWWRFLEERLLVLLK